MRKRSTLPRNETWKLVPCPLQGVKDTTCGNRLRSLLQPKNLAFSKSDGTKRIGYEAIVNAG